MEQFFIVHPISNLTQRLNTYENTKEHTEYLLLKQNDKAKWEIFDYNYEFDSEKVE